MASGSAFDELTNKIAYAIMIVGRGGDNDNTFIGGTDTTNDQHGLLVQTETGMNLRSVHRFPFGVSGGDDLTSGTGKVISTGLIRLWITRDDQSVPADVDIFINTELGLSNVGSSTAFTSALNLAIGREAVVNDTSYLTGEIAEILGYSGALRPNASAALVTYLQTKWAVD